MIGKYVNYCFFIFVLFPLFLNNYLNCTNPELSNKLLAILKNNDIQESKNSNFNIAEGKTEIIKLKDLLNALKITTSERYVKSYNASDDQDDDETSEIDLNSINNGEIPPTESDSDGRLYNSNRGRSRTKRFKNRRGERLLKYNYPDTSSDSEVNTESNIHKSSDDSSDSDSLSDSNDSLNSDTTSEISTEESSNLDQSAEYVNSKINEESEESEMEDISSLLNMEKKPHNELDEAINLLHKQMNKDAKKIKRENLDKKKKFEKNQEQIMDKLVSLIDSMQRKSPIKKKIIDEEVKNHNIIDLEKEPELFSQAQYKDLVLGMHSDFQKNKKSYDQLSIENELKIASNANKIFKNNKRNYFSNLIKEDLIKETETPYEEFKNLNKDLKVLNKKSQTLNKKSEALDKKFKSLDKESEALNKEPKDLDKNTEALNKELKNFEEPIQKKVNFAIKTKLESLLTKNNENLPYLNSLESKFSSKETQADFNDFISTSSSGTSISDPEEFPSSPKNFQNTLYDEPLLDFESSKVNDSKDDDLGNLSDSILRFNSELLKLENKPDLNLKKSNVSNTFGRIKPKDNISVDELSFKTVNYPKNILNQGNVSVGRLKINREKNSLIKPLVTVGRLKSPSKMTTNDRMRPLKKESKLIEYDYDQAQNLMNDILQSQSQVNFPKPASVQIQSSSSIHSSPYDLPKQTPSIQTHFVGENYEQKNQEHFRKGMLSKKQHVTMEHLENLQVPIVKIPMKVQRKKRLIGRTPK